MTLEDAIAHAKAVARENRYRTKHVLFHNNDIDEINSCIECAEEHEQLAEWLEELKMYKSLAPRELVSEKQKNDRSIEYSKGFDYGFKIGYAKAIDDFAEKVKEMYAFTILEEEQLNEIAEQLKE